MRLRNLGPLHVDTLMRMPEWLQSDDPRARSRLFPAAYTDADDLADWQRYAHPDLAHLYASRVELISTDLASLDADEEMTFQMIIPDKHGAAWLSALNGARLVLYSLHDLTVEDMETDPADLDDVDKELVLLRIHVMAYLQELLIEAGV
ncbi:MAG: DUF2017 family protein [Planctomycetota bacterium]